MKSWLKVTFHGIYPFFTILTTLLIFAPIALYTSNIDEFQSSIVTLMIYSLIFIMLVIIISTCIYASLPIRFKPYWVSVCTIISVLLWIQGNLLVWKYGLFDGQGISYEYINWRGFVDASLWTSCIFGAFILSKQVVKLSVLICSLILMIQLISVSYLMYNHYEELINKQKSITDMPQSNIQFSLDKNIIHITLDAFQSDLFEQIVFNEYELFYRKLSGFTFFRETVGSFPTTYMSLPAIFSGLNYKNDVPMGEFFKNTFDEKSFLVTLQENDFECESITTSLRGVRNSYIVPKPFYGDSFKLGLFEISSVIDFSLFRYLPHFVKGVIYNNQTWTLQRIFSEPGLMYDPINHGKFFDNYLKLIEVVPKKPTYKYIHLYTSHMPIVLDNNCNYLGHVAPYDKEHLLPQLKCSLTQVANFFEKLKKMGIYDKSMIILQADHGAGKAVQFHKCSDPVNKKSEVSGNIIGCALPLLAIKPFNAKSPLKISNAQVALTDIPSTIVSEVGIGAKFPGKSVFEVGEVEVRERQFGYYKWRHEHWQADYFEKLDFFAVTGSVFDQCSWVHIATFYPPEKKISSDAPSKLSQFDQAIRFLKKDNNRVETIKETLSIASGENLSIVVHIENCTDEIWRSEGDGSKDKCNRVRLGCYWIDSSGERLRTEGYGLLKNDLMPNTSILLDIVIPAPTKSGRYTLKCSMVHECYTWFDAVGGTPGELIVNVQ